MGKIYGRTAADFAAEAIALALDDAGLEKSDIDGLLINGNGNRRHGRHACRWRSGFEDLTLMNVDERVRLDRRRDGAVRSLALDAGLVDTSCSSTPTRRCSEAVGRGAAYAAPRRCGTA